MPIGFQHARCRTAHSWAKHGHDPKPSPKPSPDPKPRCSPRPSMACHPMAHLVISACTSSNLHTQAPHQSQPGHRDTIPTASPQHPHSIPMTSPLDPLTELSKRSQVQPAPCMPVPYGLGEPHILWLHHRSQHRPCVHSSYRNGCGCQMAMAGFTLFSVRPAPWLSERSGASGGHGGAGDGMAGQETAGQERHKGERRIWIVAWAQG